MKPKIKLPNLVKDYQNKEKIILRDYLALERTTMANQRTLYAVIRTAIYLVLAGIAFITLETFTKLNWVGYVLFAISGLMVIFGVIRFLALRKKLSRFYGESMKDFEEDQSG
ncbi:DUF202 domain-containing protein [Ekhidna sp.]|uniref:DUF202 domain-containing protein n=1 Tax=Ekhidna sp. TaxID=2608089 RepID=UPI003CCC194B